MNEAVYSMLPINKTAAVVTSQAGCNETPSVAQQLENLKLRAKQLHTAFIKKTYRSESERKALAAEFNDVNNQIKLLRETNKIRQSYDGIESVFIEVAKEVLTPFLYKQIMSRSKLIFEQQERS